MKRFAIIASMFLMLMGCVGQASAQDIPDLKGKMVYGGNFGFGVSGRHLNFSIAPQIGYRIFHPWELGVRGIYNLQCYFDRVSGNEYAHYFGVAPYTNVEVFRGLFLHAEDEIMYGINRWNDNVKNDWYNSVFVGIGYRQYTYAGSFAYFMVLCNLTWFNVFPSGKWETPYNNPISVRIGYCF